METARILEELRINRGYFPLPAVRAAIERRDETVPLLLDVLEATARDAASLLDEPEHMAHLYAMFLLAQFRETRAYPLIVKLFSMPGETAVDLSGDFVTEDLDAVLATICGGDTGPIMGLVENPHLSEWVRDAAIRALMILVANGCMPRDELVNYFKSLFDGKLERSNSPTSATVWDCLAGCSMRIHATELRGELDEAFEEGLVWEDSSLVEAMEQVFAEPRERVLEHLRHRYARQIDDTVAEMEGWACFHRHGTGGDLLPSRFRSGLDPVVKREESIGRNDPCPCGSGRKYKKCCLGKLGPTTAPENVNGG